MFELRRKSTAHILETHDSPTDACQDDVVRKWNVRICFGGNNEFDAGKVRETCSTTNKFSEISRLPRLSALSRQRDSVSFHERCFDVAATSWQNSVENRKYKCRKESTYFAASPLLHAGLAQFVQNKETN